ncbi:LytTR family DNA-binding domain-containing protein [Leisingera sp. NJS204]|uniref:LytTR family DNA-binding domain-containing protein n=1 Tax=Leisingera sp. NJS204 TaxID=2508307 RepID=UPI0010117E75|nr:LytTR family DNA-binding domain-containing protein [Leisingera sp. NJS204]QAX28743.1 LytTR family transcriptional regulator [Leisingera sp. NJS204]
MQLSSGSQGGMNIALSLFGLSGISWQRLWAYAASLSFAAALILTSFSPQPTAELSYLAAAASWFIHFFLSIGIVLGTAMLCVRLGLGRTPSLTAGTLCLPVLLSPVSLLLDQWFSGTFSAPPGGIIQNLFDEFTSVGLSAVVCSAFFTIAASKLAAAVREHRKLLAAFPATEPMLRSALPNVPHNLGNDLIRIEAQGHYVNVITADGKVLIKQPFAESVAALEEFTGLQCHRSHWLNLKHAKGIKRVGSAYACEMSNGDNVPVSRRKYSELRHKI